MATKYAVRDCFADLMPALQEMQALIACAPCNRGGLALMVATHAITVAALELGKDPYTQAADVTDLILSAEIMAISLASVATRPLLVQAIALAIVSLLLTVAVYGVVGFIVKFT